MRALLALPLLLTACGTIPAADNTTPNVGLTSDARRIDAGPATIATPQGHATYCGDGSTGCVWTQHDGGAMRCEWHAAHSEGEWWCKVDEDGEVTETLCAIGGDYCYPPTVVDSWAECGRRAEAYACGDDSP